MYSVFADEEKNVLIIKIAGSISFKEAKTMSDKIIKKTEHLQQGFIVIDDLSQFELGDPRGGMHLQRVLKIFLQKKCRAVIRIIGDSRVAMTLFTKFSKIFQRQIPIYYITDSSALPGKIKDIKKTAVS
jgi:anti-anti-sigma regulatory factor